MYAMYSGFMEITEYPHKCCHVVRYNNSVEVCRKIKNILKLFLKYQFHNYKSDNAHQQKCTKHNTVCKN